MGKVKMKKQLISVITAVCLGITGLGAGMYGTIASHAEQEQSVRIMAIGDSITDGYIDGNNGYRKYFCYDAIITGRMKPLIYIRVIPLPTILHMQDLVVILLKVIPEETVFMRQFSIWSILQNTAQEI